MVVKKYILNTIQQLDRLYNSAPAPEATYYSKLAIIELCGWIEISMDNIADNFAKRHLQTKFFKDRFKTIKKTNNGFDYDSNFRKMMCQTIGLLYMERLEISITTSGDLAILIATLNTLKELRNDAAHTFIGATTTYQAPSSTKAQLEKLYPILRKIEQSVQSM